MIIGHVPVGYIAAKLSQPYVTSAFFWGLLCGSALPDAHMLWFHLVDAGQTHHHTYLTHRPALWLALFGLGWIARDTFVRGLAIGALLHLALDSLVGQIAWAWPLTDHSAPFVIVPSTQDWWVMSFVLHWTFAIELVLLCLAMVIFCLSHRKRKNRST